VARERPAWWKFLLAASFVTYYLLLLYCDLVRPEPEGFRVEFRGGRLLVRDVAPDSPGARAGLRAGDEIAVAGGQPLQDRLDWIAVQSNIEPEVAIPLDVERVGGRRELVLTLGAGSTKYWRTQPGMLLLGTRGVQLITLILALVIAFKRPNDPVAGLAALLLAAGAVFWIVPPYGIAAVWRRLPFPIAALLWVPFGSTVVLGSLVFTFFALFPRKAVRSPAVWALSWTAMALAAVPCGYYAFHVVYRPEWTAGLSGWVFLVPAVGSGLALAGLAVAVANYHRLSDITERRRARVVLLGAVVGSLSGIPLTLSYWLSASTDVSQSLFASPAPALGTLLLLAVPLSFAYATLRHRLFGIALIIRQGVRYALARSLLLSVVPAFVLVLFADVLSRGDRPLLAILRSHGWAYLTLAGFAGVAHSQRQHWLDALDRRFFRERHDARRLLRQIAADLRSAGSLEGAATRVVAQVEAALHPGFAALMVRAPGEPDYHPLASAPVGRSPDTLPAESRLVALLRLLGKPLELSESGWLKDELPPREMEFLRETQIELLVPIATHPGQIEALLALAAKRSEEPYIDEDLDLLQTIADSLSLSLDHRVASNGEGGALAECPQCQACYDPGTKSCGRDAADLVVQDLPRLLMGRHRLERRIGSGGMGVVYAATDTALQRAVAVKVIRRDRVGDVEGRRFLGEARAAAGFAHPNVVTIYDYGVTAGGHAFLVMELLEGRTLREELRREGRLPPESALEIFRDVCEAVDAAHRRQLVHRDLKPENIFLAHRENERTAKILDFGLAKRPVKVDISSPTRFTAPGAVVGTPLYMAPEQLRGEDVDPAWDLWALGVVAFESLTGKHPFGLRPVETADSPTPAYYFTGGTAGGRVDSGGSAYEGAIIARLGESPKSWREFFLNALALERARRPSSARAFFAGFEQTLTE